VKAAAITSQWTHSIASSTIIATGRGGGILDLLEIARELDRRGAIDWLEANCGLDAHQRLSDGEWQRDSEGHRAAEWWVICAEALAMLSLEDLDSTAPRRAAMVALRD
jgi:hypothetical protein